MVDPSPKSPEDDLRRTLRLVLLRDPHCEHDRERLEGYLRDLAPRASGKLRRVLLEAQHGIPDLRNPRVPSRILKAHLRHSLSVDHGFADALAEWAVGAWALALGIPTRTVVVSPDGAADYTTVVAAIQAAAPGDRILLRPGLYRENLVLREDIALEADGSVADVVVEPPHGPALAVSGGSARIVGLTLRAVDPAHCAVDISDAAPLIEACRVESNDSGDAAAIESRGALAAPILRGCSIRGASGLSFFDSSGGSVESCRVESLLAAVLIDADGDPTVTRCILRGTNGGVVVGEGRGVFAECQISGSRIEQVVLSHGASPRFYRCTIEDGHGDGIWVLGASGWFEECVISGHGGRQILVSGAAHPTFVGCAIRDGGSNGVCVEAGGAGLFEGCDISGHVGQQVHVTGGAQPTLRRCMIRGGSSNGVWVDDDRGGLFDNCDVSGHALDQVVVGGHAQPVFRACMIHDGKGCGVTAHGECGGLFEACEIFGNEGVSVVVLAGAQPTFVRCSIHEAGSPSDEEGA